MQSSGDRERQRSGVFVRFSCCIIASLLVTGFRSNACVSHEDDSDHFGPCGSTGTDKISSTCIKISFEVSVPFFILCKSSVRVYLVQDNATQCVCCVRVSTSGKVTKLN